MLTGPIDFFTFMDDKSFLTSFGFIFQRWYICLTCSSHRWHVSTGNFGKNDLNWSTKKSDLPTPSFTRDPFFFSGGVPILSWRIDFICW